MVEIKANTFFNRGHSMGEIISVIVPVYNVQKYLRRCIDSILNQTYRNLEIILVDDGSSDESGAICDNYASEDNRIKVIHKSNGGLSSARNAGILESTGNYICFVDSDDWLDERYVEVLYKLINTHQADISACRFCEAVEGQPVTENKLSVNSLVITDNLMLHAITEKTYAGFACNKLFQSKIIKDNNLLFDEKIFNGEDLPFTVDYLRYCSKVAYTPSQLYYYNIRPQSITTTRKFSERYYTILYAREKVLGILSEEAPDCVDIETAAYLFHLIKMKYVLEPIKNDKSIEYQEVMQKLKMHKPKILSLKGVSTKTKLKLFLMVNFSGIFGSLYRKKKL